MQGDIAKKRQHTHDTHVRPLHSLVEIAVIEDKKGALATSLQSDVLQVRCCSLHDVAASNSTSRESDLVDIRMFRKPQACGPSVSVDDVDHTWRETSFFDQGGKEQCTKRCLLCWLEHNGVAASQCWTEFPSSHLWDLLTATCTTQLDGYIP